MKKVLIEVKGGIAHVVYKDKGVRLEIRDYDNSYGHIENYDEWEDAETLKEIKELGLEPDEGGMTMDRKVYESKEEIYFEEYYHVFRDRVDECFDINEKEKAWELFHRWCKQHERVRIYYVRDDRDGNTIDEDCLGSKGSYPA